MKIKVFLLLLATILFGISVPVSVFAEQETLFSLRERGLGGYGGPSFKLTSINGQFSVLGGGPLVLLVSPSIGTGISFSSIEGDADGLEVWYVGFFGEYYLIPEKSVNFSIGIILGGGGSTYEDPEDISGKRYTSGMFVFEPEVYVNFKIASYLRLSLGAGYRLVTGVSGIPGIQSSDVNGISGIIKLSYGLF
jgi:hypothetical protein